MTLMITNKKFFEPQKLNSKNKKSKINKQVKTCTINLVQPQNHLYWSYLPFFSENIVLNLNH